MHAIIIEVDNHAFLSSIEAEIITFIPKKVAIFFCLALQPSYEYFNMAPFPELIYSKTPHTKNGAFIRSVTVTQKIDLNRPHY